MFLRASLKNWEEPGDEATHIHVHSTSSIHLHVYGLHYAGTFDILENGEPLLLIDVHVQCVHKPRVHSKQEYIKGGEYRTVHIPTVNTVGKVT